MFLFFFSISIYFFFAVPSALLRRHIEQLINFDDVGKKWQKNIRKKQEIIKMKENCKSELES